MKINKNFEGWINEKHRIAWVTTRLEREKEEIDIMGFFEDLKKQPELTVDNVKKLIQKGYTSEKIVKELNAKVYTYFCFLQYHKIRNWND